jgi:hypothetical protein
MKWRRAMNPIFTWVAAEAMAKARLRMRARQCPKCRRKQFVDEEKILREAPCKYCKAPMPPKTGVADRD